MPPAGRTVLVNGFEAWVELSGATFAISSQRYNPDVFYPNGVDRLSSCRLEPWPIWTFDLSAGFAIEQEFFAVHGSQTVALSWRLAGDSSVPAKLRIRPLLSGRDFHSTHHENSSFQFAAIQKPERVIWHPYQDLPSIEARSNGTYHLHEAGLNHISEIVDAESPHTPRGCPFQAWSMGEYLRLLSTLSQ
jgi:glycogen debranching enzyme